MIEQVKSFFVQSVRVWHLLKKPSAYEYKSIAKVSGLGILVIGALGFLISDGVKIISGLFS